MEHIYLSSNFCWFNIYVSPHIGTGPMLELGPFFRPVLELGREHPHTGTAPPWSAQCWKRAPRSGTVNLTLNLSATITCTVPVWGRPRPSSSTGRKNDPSSSTGQENGPSSRTEPVPIWGPTGLLKVFFCSDAILKSTLLQILWCNILSYIRRGDDCIWGILSHLAVISHIHWVN